MYKWIYTFFCLLFFLSSAKSQEISIELGPDEIGENQVFTITITAHNEPLRSYDDFPEISNFIKRGTSSSSSTTVVNGKVSSSQSITMSYSPTKQGKFKLNPFTLKVNGKNISSPGKNIIVGEPVKAQNRSPFHNFRDPFDDFNGNRSEPEFIDIKEDAFLSLTTDKQEVYVGEGITANLSFYVAESNRAPLQFYELGKQLSEILKILRPENCWEENFNIENINGKPILINGKSYNQYKIYEGTFFPFNNEDIIFKSIGLKMIKYQIAKNPSFFGTNRKEDFKTFHTKEKVVKVKELPPHPLKEMVAVGDYKMNEKINVQQINTGQSFTYDFSIYGEGNISSIEKPLIKTSNEIDFYEPNVTQKVNRMSGKITGSKTFSYYGIPNEPKDFELKDYIQWIFFNPKKESYDTLSPTITLLVTGESKKNEAISATDMGSFYDRIGDSSTHLRASYSTDWLKIVANILIFAMIAISSYILFFKK